MGRLSITLVLHQVLKLVWLGWAKDQQNFSEPFYVLNLVNVFFCIFLIIRWKKNQFEEELLYTMQTQVSYYISFWILKGSWTWKQHPLLHHFYLK